ncbi:hypothetical protein AB0912_00195 [Streptomyces sp. NPDC007084]|uniref:hypothetical protein n=1 Tax=Streptomyces sp. NPDC007084 TaxID=3154313 RepID=UPI003454434C
MTQRNPIAPGRRIIAAGSIRHTADRVTTVRVTEAGVTGSSMRRERVAELHRLAAADYAKGKAQRAAAVGAYTAFVPAAEPSDLAVAVDLGRRVLGSGNPVALREALRLILRALDTEVPRSEKLSDLGERCPAAFTDDAAPCDGSPVVLILDPNSRGAEACEHHGARLLAVIKNGRPVALPDAPEGTASRVFTAAATLRYFTAHQGEGR